LYINFIYLINMVVVSGVCCYHAYSEIFVVTPETDCRQHLKYQVVHVKKRETAIADKPCDTFRGQSRSPNMVPFRMFGRYSTSKNVLTLNSRSEIMQGH